LTERRIIVVGASAGGVDALMQLARALPRDFPAPLCIVLHVPPDSPSLLATILDRESRLPAKTAQHGEVALPGTIYVAPPDRHLVIGDDGTLHVTRGPRENRHRPAVDPLFRSAALVFRERAIAVVLTGTLDDGTAGMISIRDASGITIVQDPRTALYPGMPQSVMDHIEVDYAIPLSELGPLLTRLVAEDPPAARPRPVNTSINNKDLELETRMAELDGDALAADERPGHPSPYSCPDCGGVLWELKEGEYLRYRCRVGHAYSPETMLSAQDDVLEEALWSAVKTLEESARLSKRLAASERARGHEWMAIRFEDKEKDARAQVEVIRRHLLRREDSTVPIAAEDAVPPS
jgi:two-component system, chemotaxis family, protein-glutamate methylesterase/glutaminase